MFVEFQLATEKNRTLAIIDMIEVPVSGDSVKLDGKTYRVRERGWVLVSPDSGVGKSITTAWVTLASWERA